MQEPANSAQAPEDQDDEKGFGKWAKKKLSSVFNAVRGMGALRASLLAALIATGSFYAINHSTAEPEPEKIEYHQFIEKAEANEVGNVVIVNGTRVEGTLNDGDDNPDNDPAFYSDVPRGENVVDRLIETDVAFDGKNETPSAFVYMLPQLLLMGALVGFLFYYMRGTMGMGKSPAKLHQKEKTKTTFNDVAGIDEAVEDMKEIVDFLKNPKKYEDVGARIPRGALMVGPPGCGKTLSAKAMAGEADVPFYSISGSDFVEVFAGRGAARVRDLFKEAKKNAPCIIFIDEIDAVGQNRSKNSGMGHDEQGQTLNALLTEMEGFDTRDGVIVLAATNRPESLDPALTRPGRFDRQIVVSHPDMVGRQAILGVHAKDKKLADDVDIKVIAQGTPRYSGADLENLMNEAALLAVRDDRKEITMDDFEEARDKVMMGSKNSSLTMTEEEIKLTAYHEAGHALLSLTEEDSDPIHKATIVPRGRALGLVMRLPVGDRISTWRSKLKADLAIAAAGRAAESVIFGEDRITTGAESDIQHMTNIATKMVTEWGLSEKLGMRRFRDDNPNPYLGGADGALVQVSDEKAKIIDDEIDELTAQAYERAKSVITDNREKLENIAQALLKYETLTGAEVKAVAEGKKLDKDEVTSTFKGSTSDPANDNRPLSSVRQYSIK